MKPKKAMNTSDLVRELSNRTGLSQHTTQRTLDVLLTMMIDTLGEGREVKLGGFGTFKVEERAPRTARNLKRVDGKVIVDGEIDVPAKTKVKFAPGFILRERAERNLVAETEETATV